MRGRPCIGAALCAPHHFGGGRMRLSDQPAKPHSMRRTAQLMYIKQTHCISCNVGSVWARCLFPTLLLVPTGQVLPATIAPVVKPAAAPPTVSPAVMQNILHAVAPAGTTELNPLSVPTVAVVATQLLLPTVPAPALPYPAATQPQPAQVHQTLSASRGDAASSNYLLRLQPWNSLRFTSCSQRAWLQTREMEHSGCCSSVAARKKEASGYQHLYLAAGIHVAC